LFVVVIPVKTGIQILNFLYLLDSGFGSANSPTVAGMTIQDKQISA